jgi:ABC-2 type transport system ATP-binding protein
MLTIKKLRKIYEGSTKGIENLNLEIQPGDICAFIGSNGAGKTTTLKSIVGIHPFDEGEIIFKGVDLKKESKKFKLMLGYSPDNPDIYNNLRGYEYLEFIGSVYGMKQEKFEQEVNDLAQKLDMSDSLGQLISSYSHGMKQRLVLISIFFHSPELIVLDEPFVGLDPNAAYFLTTELQRRAKMGAIIIYSTHVLEVAEKICNRVVLIDKGQVKLNNYMEEITAKESLGEVFRRVTAHE